MTHCPPFLHPVKLFASALLISVHLLLFFFLCVSYSHTAFFYSPSSTTSDFAPLLALSSVYSVASLSFILYCLTTLLFLSSCLFTYASSRPPSSSSSSSPSFAPFPLRSPPTLLTCFRMPSSEVEEMGGISD